MAMPNSLEAYAHLANQAARTGWYAIIARMTQRRVAALSQGATPFRPSRPVPREAELLRAALALQRRDAENVRQGIYPAMDDEPSLAAHI
jgi:hypothetical protein